MFGIVPQKGADGSPEYDGLGRVDALAERSNGLAGFGGTKSMREMHGAVMVLVELIDRQVEGKQKNKTFNLSWLSPWKAGGDHSN